MISLAQSTGGPVVEADQVTPIMVVMVVLVVEEEVVQHMLITIMDVRVDYHLR
jgi:hypothetical protein